MVKQRHQHKRTEPKATRPHMPGYGILDAESGKGLLPWSWAGERLEKAHTYWIATTRPDGRPHVMPVWGVWADDAFYFSTGRDSRKARNLAANPNCVLVPDGAEEAVVVEGVAEVLDDASPPEDVARRYKAKYEWDLDPSQGPIYIVRPRAAFGFIESAEDFVGTATRWLFDT